MCHLKKLFEMKVRAKLHQILLMGKIEEPCSKFKQFDVIASLHGKTLFLGKVYGILILKRS